MKDYKKKYEEALERAKIEMSKDGMKNDVIAIHLAETIFPEFKESEDERIRKGIFKALSKKDARDVLISQGIKISDALTWLEKQGDKDKLIQELGEYKVKYTQEVLEKHINSMSNKDDERLRKTTIAFLKDFAEQGYENAIECIDWLGKQGEQEKDILEDAILDGNEDGLIAETIKYRNEKRSEQKPADKNEPKFKVGDWLIFNERHNGIYQIERIDNYRYYLRHYLGGTMSVHFDNELIRLWTIQDAKDGDILMANAPFIFNGNLEGGIGCPGAHCAINTLGKFQIPKYPKHWTGHTTTPATKEQRDFLFEKMKEAGYEWDSEKKELKKFHVIDEGKAEMDYCFTKMMNNEKVSSAWSEEDEKIYQSIIDDTVQENQLDNRQINWIKSLRLQNRWKPSEAQMDSITCVVRKMKESACYDSELISLFNDLKKLKDK